MTSTDVRPLAAVRPCAPATPSTRQLEIDGKPVGPIFHALTDQIGEAEEFAHHWMIGNHPDDGYSIVSARRGHCFRRVSYPPNVVAKQYDYSPWGS